MKKSIKRVLEILLMARRHTVAKNHLIKTIFRYRCNQLGLYYKERKIRWVNDLIFFIKKGDAVFSQNPYFG
jgi:hypothetical protein